MSLTRVLLWVLVTSILMAAGLAIMAVILPMTWRTNESVLITCLLVGAFSLPAFCCALVLRKHRFVPLMWGSVISLAIALALWLVLVWVNFDWTVEMWIVRPAVIANTIGVWGAHRGLLSLFQLNGRFAKHVRNATYFFAGLLALFVLAAVISEPELEFFYKALLLLIIFTVCGTLITPTLAVIELVKGRANHGSVPSKVNIKLTCPRCGSTQDIKPGNARCRNCSLRINIELEEPRCTCGYLLYRLQGETCPECGTTIPEIDRWAAQTPDESAQPDNASERETP